MSDSRLLVWMMEERRRSFGTGGGISCDGGFCRGHWGGALFEQCDGPVEGCRRGKRGGEEKKKKGRKRAEVVVRDERVGGGGGGGEEKGEERREWTGKPELGAAWSGSRRGARGRDLACVYGSGRAKD
jgi:hypothetical protein